MRLYLAGPMAGLPDHNVPLFDLVAAKLRSLGYVVGNPADNTRHLAFLENMSVEAYRARFTDRDWRIHIYPRDLAQLLRCEGIVLLPGWPRSRGATLEALVAYQVGLRFFLWNADTTRRPDDPDEIVEVSDSVAPLTSFIKMHYAAEARAAGLESEPELRVGSVSGVVKGDPGESVCHEADRLVDGARQKDYGHPLDNYERVAGLWTEFLRGLALDFEHRNDELDAESVALMLILLKIGRLEHGYHRDSVVDIAGYAKVYDMTHTEREVRRHALG